jgi:hypothetical protein
VILLGRDGAHCNICNNPKTLRVPKPGRFEMACIDHAGCRNRLSRRARKARSEDRWLRPKVWWRVFGFNALAWIAIFSVCAALL